MNNRSIHFKTLFLAWCIIYISVNSFQLYKNLAPDHPIGFPGIKFSGLSELLKSETKINYITDLDIKESGPLAEYEQAQYILAPLILDLSREPHKFLLINCSSDISALNKLKEWKARPLLRNQFGVILATGESAPPNLSTENGIPTP
jgi:hypothetical protein